MIKHLSMKHGWFYYYRMHLTKSNELLVGCLTPLNDYLLDMFENCPHQHFLEGPRSSSLTFPIKNDSIPVENHETSILTEEAKITMEKRYKQNHSRV